MAGADISAGKAFVTLYAKRDPLTTGLKASGMQIAKWVAGIGASFLTLRAITNSLKDTAENIDRIAKGADKIGITTQSFVALDHAAKLAGASMDRVEDAIGKLQRALVDARTKGGKAAEAFTQIGLSIEQISALSPDKQFEAVADAIAGIGDPAERAAAAFKIFGRASQDLMPLLLEGSAAIEKARKETEAYGLAISRMDAKKVEEMNDAVTRLQATWSGFSMVATSALAGPLTDMLDFFTDLVTRIHETNSAIEATGVILQTVFSREARENWAPWFPGSLEPGSSIVPGKITDMINAATEAELKSNLTKSGQQKAERDFRTNVRLQDQMEAAEERRANAATQSQIEQEKAQRKLGLTARWQAQLEKRAIGTRSGLNAREQEMLERGIRPDDGFRIEDPALKATDSFLAQFEAAEQARKGALQSIRDGGVGGTFSARAAGQMAGGRLEQLAAEQVNWLKKIDEAIKGLFPVYGA